MRIRSFYGCIGVQDGIEEISSESQTVPDMSLSVKEILQRFRRGTIDPSVLYRDYPDEDDDIDNDLLDSMDDLVDVQERQMRVNSNVEQIVFRHNQERQTKEQTPQDNITTSED